MRGPLVIPWVEDTEQIVFACHTSIITDEIVKSHIRYPKQKLKTQRLSQVEDS